METSSRSKINLPVPRLGFGCSGLMMPPPDERLRILETAFDAGIRHFDVARYYGLGEAEGVLGEFLKSRRSEVTITTKFGIQPPQRSSSFKALTVVGRQVARLAPFLRSSLAKRAKGFVQSGAFSVDTAQASLETSLRELKTDYIDIYLLHEPLLEDTQTEGLLEFLQNSVKSGKIGRFGVGTSIENIIKMYDAQQHPFLKVVQFENSALTRNLERLPTLDSELVITHRPLAESFRQLQKRLLNDSQTLQQWSQALNVDCGNPLVLASLMLNYAVQVNQQGLVLFSSCSCKHIESNIASVIESPFTPEQLQLFSELSYRLASSQLVTSDLTP